MGFVIKKIVVHSEPTRVRGGETHYNMVREKWDVRTLLEVEPFSILLDTTILIYQLIYINCIYMYRFLVENIVTKTFA